MLKINTVLFLFIGWLGAPVWGQNFPQKRASELRAELLQTVDIGGHPESVLVSQFTVFVSNMGKEAGVKLDGDGYITKLSTDLEELTPNFAPTVELNSPTGMIASRDGILYVNDVNRVVGIDMRSGLQVFEADLSFLGVTFANDIEFLTSSQSELLLTATNISHLIRVDVVTGLARVMTYPYPSGQPNGITYVPTPDLDDKDIRGVFLLAGNKKHSLGEDVSNGFVETFYFLPTMGGGVLLDGVEFFDLGLFVDGVELFKEDYLLISDWKGFGAEGELKYLDVYDGAGAEVKTIPLGLSGFADFDLDHTTGKLYAPSLLSGTLSVYQLMITEDRVRSGQAK